MFAHVLVRAPFAQAEVETRRTAYGVDVGILWDSLTFHLPGALEEWVDRAAGRYEIKAVGQGSRIQNRIESRGTLRDGRWAPLEATSWFEVAGRQTRSQTLYDYEQRTAEYHFKGETFLLRRQRIADDVLTLPPGVHVDDALSAVLNYADGRWPASADGEYRTAVVRRQRLDKEGADDVAKVYKAELAPLLLKVAPERESGKLVASLDLTRFSSWARQAQPARVIFGPDRRPESISASLILGTSISIRIGGQG